MADADAANRPTKAKVASVLIIKFQLSFRSD